MALKAMLDAAGVAGLPADIQKEYTKAEDGTFRLTVEPANGYALENVTGLKTALQTERQQREELAKVAKQYEGLDAAAAREALKRVDEIKNWSPDQKVQEQIAASVKTVEGKYKSELETRESRIKSLETGLSTALIDQAAVSAIAKLNGTPELLLPHVRSMTRIREVGGKHVVDVINPADGTVRISPNGTSTSNMTLDELVAEMKASSVYGRAFAGSGASGGGAGEGGKGGGGASFTISDSEARRDPHKYRQVRDAAAKAGQRVTIVDDSAG